MNEENIRGGQIIHHNEWGNEYVIDERGNHIPPMQTSKNSKSSGFTTFDTSQGHCGLCGSLTCNGGCFK